MKIAKLRVKTFANDPTIPHDHGSHERIRAYPTTPARRKLKRPPQVSTIRVCELGIHATD